MSRGRRLLLNWLAIAYPCKWPRSKILRTSMSRVPGEMSNFVLLVPIDSPIIGRLNSSLATNYFRNQMKFEVYKSTTSVDAGNCGSRCPYCKEWLVRCHRKVWNTTDD